MISCGVAPFSAALFGICVNLGQYSIRSVFLDLLEEEEEEEEEEGGKGDSSGGGSSSASSVSPTFFCFASEFFS